MNKQWQAGFNAGRKDGEAFGEMIGEKKAKMGICMTALCMATAIRDAQKRNLVSQYILLETLIDILAKECGGRLDDQVEQEADHPF